MAKVTCGISIREKMFRDGYGLFDRKEIKEPALQLHARIEAVFIPGEAFPKEDFEDALMGLEQEFERRSKELNLLQQYNEIA